MNLSVSVVVNTLDRASTLRDTLRALKTQTYKNFEVIVVNGPSTDETQDVLSSYSRYIKIHTSKTANLSRSRNIGIAASCGDIIAFIDDDAVPDPTWLETGLLPFTDKLVAVTGTDVKDFDGINYQDSPWVVDRYFNPVSWYEPPLLSFSESSTQMLPHVVGCSSFFRKDALINIDGFNNEIEYFLDESEAQYLIHKTPNSKIVRMSFGGVVLHRWKKSKVREDHEKGSRGIKNPYPIIKNKAYCIMKYCGNERELAFKAIDSFRQAIVNEAPSGALRTGYMDAIARGLRDGLARAVERRSGLKDVAKSVVSAPFLRFPTREDILHVCITTKWSADGGVGAYFYELAQELTNRGHAVHVIQQSSKNDASVSYRDGMWIHEIVPDPECPMHHIGSIGENNLRYAMAVHRELCEIHRRNPIDIVYTPLWDLEGLFSTQDRRWRTVVALQTTFHHFSDINREKLDPLAVFWSRQLEKLYLAQASYFHAISSSIENYAKQIEPATEGKPTLCSPIALSEPAQEARANLPAVPFILFIGRLEPRKNVVRLVEAFATIMGKTKHNLVIAGRDVESYLSAEFSKIAASKPGLSDRVTVLGEISEDQKSALLRQCDFVCVPSIFESFGLVAIEAFCAGKAVVAANVGGLKEIVENGQTGILFEPHDTVALASALLKLTQSRELTERMGREAKLRYLEKYTVQAMTNSLEAFFMEICQ